MFSKLGRAAVLTIAGAAWRNRRQLMDGARRLVGRPGADPVGAQRGNPARTMDAHDDLAARVAAA